MLQISIELDDDAMQIARDYAADKNIPVEGAVVLLITAAARLKAKDAPEVKPANERLADLADAFEKSPPTTTEDIAAFAEQLRYLAQFTTTFEIGFFSGRSA